MKIAGTRFGRLQRRKIGKAVDYATTKHSDQKRASGEPYITHPLAVASILVEWRMDQDTVIAGILHDTVEDTDASLKEIEKQFGKKIAGLVDGVTKVTAAREGMRSIDSYQQRTRDNLSKLLIAVGQDPRVLFIKLADRLHNLRTLEHLPPAKQQKIAKESLEIFARLADRLNMGRVRVQIEEIAFSYINPKRFNHLKRLTKKRVTKALSRFDHVKKEVSDELNKHNIKHTIDGRIKSIYSLHKKLAKYNEDIDEIYDLMALRIIVDSEAECYQTLGILHKIYHPLLHKIKDYISAPKANGYQSLHTTVSTPEKQIVEFQIRTQQMHDLAEHGLAASFYYNEQKNSKGYLRLRKVNQLPQHLGWINKLQEAARAAGDGTPAEDLTIDLFGDRIFVYSPKGDIYDLPEGAYPLDFAYAVHSDIGDKASTFLINDKIARFNQKLQSGDRIEIKTKANAKPSSDWLKFAKTSHARNKIRRLIK